jgi:hypothetical protein
MKQSEYYILDELTAMIQQRLQSAQKRVKNTSEDYMKRYYKGQVDTLNVVLRDIATSKFEMGLELEPEEVVREQRPDVPSEPVPQIHYEYKELAHEAIRRGIIGRKISWFYHELLPDKRIKGYTPLYEALAAHAEFRQTVQEACAVKPAATVSADPQIN